MLLFVSHITVANLCSQDHVNAECIRVSARDFYEFSFQKYLWIICMRSKSNIQLSYMIHSKHFLFW